MRFFSKYNDNVVYAKKRNETRRWGGDDSKANSTTVRPVCVETHRNGVWSHDVTLEPLPVVLVTVLGCLALFGPPNDDRLFGS